MIGRLLERLRRWRIARREARADALVRPITEEEREANRAVVARAHGREVGRGRYIAVVEEGAWPWPLIDVKKKKK